MDFHESCVTQRGSILVTTYNYTQTDLTSVSGPADGWIYDGLLSEIDIKKQNLSSQSAAAHVPIDATKLPLDGDGNATYQFEIFFFSH